MPDRAGPGEKKEPVTPRAGTSPPRGRVRTESQSPERLGRPCAHRHNTRTPLISGVFDASETGKHPRDGALNQGRQEGAGEWPQQRGEKQLIRGGELHAIRRACSARAFSVEPGQQRVVSRQPARGPANRPRASAAARAPSASMPVQPHTPARAALPRAARRGSSPLPRRTGTCEGARPR